MLTGSRLRLAKRLICPKELKVNINQCKFTVQKLQNVIYTLPFKKKWVFCKIFRKMHASAHASICQAVLPSAST